MHRTNGIRDRRTLAQGDVFSAGEITSAFVYAHDPYRGVRLSMGTPVEGRHPTPVGERQVRRRLDSINLTGALECAEVPYSLVNENEFDRQVRRRFDSSSDANELVLRPEMQMPDIPSPAPQTLPGTRATGSDFDPPHPSQQAPHAPQSPVAAPAPSNLDPPDPPLAASQSPQPSSGVTRRYAFDGTSTPSHSSSPPPPLFPPPHPPPHDMLPIGDYCKDDTPCERQVRQRPNGEILKM